MLKSIFHFSFSNYYKINNIELNDRDALEIVGEDIIIKSKELSHVLILEMKKA